MLRFSGAGVSEVGLRREHNEDSAFVGPYVALVADGVGGAAAGEVASATATFALTATALARFGDPVDSVLRSGVAAARQSVRRASTSTRPGSVWPPRSRPSPPTAIGSCWPTSGTRAPTPSGAVGCVGSPATTPPCRT